jgi:hypothetical protein
MSCCSRDKRCLLAFCASGILATASASSAIVRPDHVVVVIEQDRASDAIGNPVMPYFNALAASGLYYSNSHGVTHPSEPNELSLYSGSTQNVTDNGRNYSFSGPNLAKSLFDAGFSFSGYIENLPANGSQVTQAGDAQYPDLYTRNMNAMAQFTNVGTVAGGGARPNSAVNKTFGAFSQIPTTDYSSLPTVSFIVPNNLHSTHGSNEAYPWAGSSDEVANDMLRGWADTWLHDNVDSYLQWAKTHNSLLVVTQDEERWTGGTALTTTTIVHGSSNLFVPGVDPTSVNHYSLLRTIEDMYGLSPLGNSATVPAYHTNGAGRLSAPAIVASWSGNAGTTIWGSGGNWIGGGIPDSVDTTANFGPAVASVHSVTVDGTRVVGVLAFNDPTKYTLGGAGTINIDTTGNAGSISVVNGSHDIVAALTLSKPTSINVTNAADTLKITNLKLASVAITKQGAGALSVNVLRASGMTINGGVVRVAPGRSTSATSKVSSLTIAGGASPTAAIDLGDNDLIIDYTGSSPLTTIAAQIASGFGAGSWNGNGIRSSIASTDDPQTGNPRTALGFSAAPDYAGYASGQFSGQSIDATSVLIKFTLAGDANLDGEVDTVDFNTLSSNFGATGKIWSAGDFNYSGTIDTVDFNLLSAEFGQSLPAPDAFGAFASVPEPATLVPACMVLCAVVERRRTRPHSPSKIK